MALDETSDYLRLTLAEILEARKDPAGAASQLDGILRANPRSADAALARSSLAIRAGESEVSRRVLQASVDAGVRDPDILDRLAIHLLRAGSKDEAEKLFRQTLELDPEDATALLELGRASMRIGNVDAAMESFGRCALGSRAFECRMELARAYVVGRRDLEAAKIQLRSARELATDDRQRKEVDERLRALEEASKNR